jgi:hypothetical protein
MIFKGDHLLKDFHGIPKILEVWYQGSQQPMSSTIIVHAGENPSTDNHWDGGKKGQVNILASYVEKCTVLTFSLIWKKLHNCWKKFLFPNNNLQLLTMNLLLTNHWLMKCSI